MHETDTPLFETECFGAIITYVKVFPTHITFQQQHTRYISLPSHMLASVEEIVCKSEFVILRTTTRQRIICMVRPEGSTTTRPNRAAALYAAIRDAYGVPLATTNSPSAQPALPAMSAAMTERE